MKSPVRDERMVLPSLTGLAVWMDAKPTAKAVGYFQRDYPHAPARNYFTISKMSIFQRRRHGIVVEPPDRKMEAP